MFYQIKKKLQVENKKYITDLRISFDKTVDEKQSRFKCFSWWKKKTTCSKYEIYHRYDNQIWENEHVRR